MKEAIVLTIYALIVLGPVVVLVLKRRFDILIVGLLTLGLVWLVGVGRPARPGSWWDRRFSQRTTA